MEGLMGVMGDTEGCIGDRLVGDVTESEERLSERLVEDLLSTMAESFMEVEEELFWVCCCW